MGNILRLSLCSIIALSSIYIMNIAQAKHHKPRYDYQTLASKVLHRTYVGVKGGVSTPIAFSFHPGNIKHLDSSASLGGLLGYRINQWFRSDIEISQRFRSTANRDSVSGSNVQLHSTKLSSTTALLNGYFLLPQMYAQPFITAGLGISKNKLEDYKVQNSTQWPGNSKTSFAYQVGGGITFSHEKIDFDAIAQFINHGKAHTKAMRTTAPIDKSPAKVDFKDFLFSISLRYNL